MIAIVAAAAWGAPPLPTLRQVLARDAWRGANALLEAGCRYDPQQGGVACEEGVTADVVARADAFERVVGPDGPVAYLGGLAARYAGDTAEAEQRYRRALELDPTLVEAWYDLGELDLAAGRVDDAERAFREVATRKSTGEAAWLGPWRLAEVAAQRHDPRGLERNLKDALERGFRFEHVAGLPNWREYYADPALHGTLEALLTVYADEQVRDSLGAP